jgi:hypothetical protein
MVGQKREKIGKTDSQGSSSKITAGYLIHEKHGRGGKPSS